MDRLLKRQSVYAAPTPNDSSSSWYGTAIGRYTASHQTVIRYDVGWVDLNVRDWTIGICNEHVERTSMTVCWTCNVLDQVECGQQIEQRCSVVVSRIFNMHIEVAANDDWTLYVTSISSTSDSSVKKELIDVLGGR